MDHLALYHQDSVVRAIYSGFVDIAWWVRAEPLPER
jgi:hypothetical protein